MRNILLILLLIQISACTKDGVDFILEKSMGSGSAYNAEIASDSTFLVAGQSEEKPLLIKTGKGSGIDISYSPAIQGSFTGIEEFEGGYLLAGSTDGNIALNCINKEGEELWDTIVTTGPRVRISLLSHYEDNTYMLVASDDPDSLTSSTFIIALFDIYGDFLQINEAIPGFRASLTGLEVISPQEIYVSLTKDFGTGNSKASVARLTAEGNIVWEQELYNNRDYMARSLAIKADAANLYIAGSTRYTAGDGDVSNSFVASLTRAGTLNWKVYLEAGNAGSDLDFDSGMNLVLLNRNCMLLSGITLPGAEETRQIRFVDACDSYDTEILGESLLVNCNDDYLVAGSKAGKFYYALKSGTGE